MSLPLVVPLRDALFVLAILVVVALASNLALYAYLAAQSTLPPPPSPARGECGWEKRPGDEGPGEAGSSLPLVNGSPSPGGWVGDGRGGQGVRWPGEGTGEAGSWEPVP